MAGVRHTQRASALRPLLAGRQALGVFVTGSNCRGVETRR